MKFKQSKKIRGLWHIENLCITDLRGSLVKVYDEKLFYKLKKKFNFEWKQVLISYSKKANKLILKL